jgi:hypothetical protein
VTTQSLGVKTILKLGLSNLGVGNMLNVFKELIDNIYDLLTGSNTANEDWYYQLQLAYYRGYSSGKLRVIEDNPYSSMDPRYYEYDRGYMLGMCTYRVQE